MLQCPNSQTLQHQNKISTRRPSRRLVLTIGHKSGDSAEERGEHDGGAIFLKIALAMMVVMRRLWKGCPGGVLSGRG
jgi:hypothetical protein